MTCGSFGKFNPGVGFNCRSLARDGDEECIRCQKMESLDSILALDDDDE